MPKDQVITNSQSQASKNKMAANNKSCSVCCQIPSDVVGVVCAPKNVFVLGKAKLVGDFKV